MKPKAGLWIDHKKAVVVVISDQGEELIQIVSKVEKHPQRSGDSPLKGRYEAQKVPADDRRQRSFTGNLNIFYEAVTACLRDAESVLILGPGEAKGELSSYLKKNNRGRIIAGVQTVDKMTDRQISAKVRDYFKAEATNSPTPPTDTSAQVGRTGKSFSR